MVRIVILALSFGFFMVFFSVRVFRVWFMLFRYILVTFRRRFLIYILVMFFYIDLLLEKKNMINR